MFKDTTSSGLLKQMKDEEGETPDHFKGYTVTKQLNVPVDVWYIDLT